jgi:hypothetical protein
VALIEVVVEVASIEEVEVVEVIVEVTVEHPGISCFCLMSLLNIVV